MAIATSTTRMLTACLLLYLCLFTAPRSCSSSTSGGGMVIEGSKQGIMVNPNDLPLYYKDDGYHQGQEEVKKKVEVMMMMMKTRKMLMMDVADYDETGANSKHDPRKGRHP
ncbi:unnamed protein product [Linum tenue]|uniref:Uncharacterized protein n=1 Tax=Linum tenue TaxID=586396 RepID=A0AAV0IJD4_9ROSI|nr:unnamed protein product [Linum tenue]